MQDTCCETPTLKRYIGIYIDIEEISRDTAIEPLTSVGLMSTHQPQKVIAAGACATKSNFLPKTLTFFPGFFGLRGHRQLRPGRGDGEAGVYYFLLLYLVQYTYFYLLTIKHKYKFIN